MSTEETPLEAASRNYQAALASFGKMHLREKELGQLGPDGLGDYSRDMKKRVDQARREYVGAM